MTSTPAQGTADDPPGPPASTYDAELIQAVAAGDPYALHRLMVRNSPWLQARLLQRRIALDVVDDVLQETFIAVNYSAGTYRDGNARGWLWTIAQRKLVDQLRKRGRLDAAVEREGALARSATTLVAPSAEDAALGTQLTGTSVGDALTTLPDDAREILTLRYVDGFSVRETAERLGISQGTVKSRASRACEELRGRLGALRRQGGDGR
ncbi:MULTISPECIES: RNA polymerase sigma factor [unclassified Streptomyces]|uniref:RNA polymerase sigma factor n=1 Tax=unclassified Streptomyces TaxID=2593676 RepID=UPI0022525C6D|nr:MULTISPECIES: RNA polymerase sigma factor [unclassified Streptomyces]MCX4971445.1 RNA polymerase sigma factor [Streptomyces sp. NBC_00620]WUC14015.1 RNA polymerase sigma factor [Streptomyces sp. NBC_00564]